MSSKLLLDKTAIITGGSTGIGYAITLAFISHGCTVIVNHLGRPQDAASLAALHAAAADIQRHDPQAGALHELAGDVRQQATAAALVSFAVARSARGRLDVCVSNAGICEFAEFLTMGADLFADTLATNLTGSFFVVQAAGRQMARQVPPGGSIIGMSSISALVGGGRQAHYTPSKAGVLSLMQSAAVALGRYGIRCNAILPGTIRTQLNEEDLRDERKREYMEGRIPLGRTGDPKDVAGPAVFLACDMLSGYVTGAQLLVDGGLFVNLQ
ncbi:hypothetical protein TD95_004367 [Thielaviopsis punctulata]|uniref:Uncharacterized protein n=1 Tax=Thielaviopsis punctulata TaxID=72032 RepID=A0A0F4ZJY3_9PEZI|nr:hypothetical protein TD95_004367 [Thielaviopsis punctulata]